MIKLKEDAVSEYHDYLLKQTVNARAFLARVAFPAYQEAQADRWDSVKSNKGGKTSQGDWWPGLKSRKYEEWKMKVHKNHPDGGKRLLIASGKLLKNVIGPKGTGSTKKEWHHRMISKNKMVIAISGPYASYVNDARPFMSFDKKFINDLKKKWADSLRAKK